VDLRVSSFRVCSIVTAAGYSQDAAADDEVSKRTWKDVVAGTQATVAINMLCVAACMMEPPSHYHNIIYYVSAR
jgi:hypothetical protein